MLKLKATEKEIKKGYKKILSIGYCQAQNLLQYEEAKAYTAGVYGWKSDVYDIDGVAISTGYAPIGQRVNYDIVKKYEAEAEAVDYRKPYEQRREEVRALLHKWMAEELAARA